MACWYEVFDNEDVQLSTRRKVTALSAVAAVAGTVTLICLSAISSGHIGLWSAAAIVMPIWVLTTIWCIHRLRALRRVAWCLKISDDSVIAYDYSRKKILIPWSRINRVEWCGGSVRIVGPPPCTIEIPCLFADFAALSHSLCAQAERHGVPIYIDGQGIDEINLYAVYPFLHDLRVTSLGSDSDGLATM